MHDRQFIEDNYNEDEEELSSAIISFEDYHLWVDSTVLYKEDEQEQAQEQQ